MRKTFVVLSLMGALSVAGAESVQAQVWGVNPTATGSELLQINPFTGVITQTFSLASTGITTASTEIGLAGWGQNELFYTNANVANGKVWVLNPADGSTIRTFSVSGGWQMDGLGYWSNGTNSYLYTSGCSVGDMHRYSAVNGASPYYYWSDASNPKAVAGDYGGKIFTYAQKAGAWGIYEVNPTVDTGMSFFAASPSTSIVGMAYDGQYLYLSDTNNKLYTMDNAGKLAKTLELNYTLYGLGSTQGTGSVVPEPATVLLLGTGLLGLAGVAMRRRKEDDFDDQA